MLYYITVEPNTGIETGETDQRGEEKPKKGLQVVVQNPEGIFQGLSTIDNHETFNLSIQNDEMNDAVCSFLTTTVDYHDTPEEIEANSYSFRSEIHTEGKNASIAKFTQGYVSDEQTKELMSTLKQNGCTEIYPSDHEYKRIIFFSYAGNEYAIDLQFRDYESKKKWVAENLQRERFDRRGIGHVTRRKEKFLTSKNENFDFTSHYHEQQGRSGDLEQMFTEDIEKYAKAYGIALKGIYNMYSQPEPDKTLTLVYKPELGNHLQIIK